MTSNMVPLNWRFILSCLFILITRGSNGNRSQSLHLLVLNDGTKKHKVCRSTPFDFYTVGGRYLHACPLPDKVRKKAGTQLLSNQRYESHSSGVCY